MKRGVLSIFIAGSAAVAFGGCSETGSQLPAGSSPSSFNDVVPLHNSWSLGKAIPTPVLCAASAAVGAKIYVLGGVESSQTIVGLNQIYDTKTNSWSKGKAMPTPRWCAGAAVVNGIIYTVGGNTTISGISNVVEAYDPKKNSWSEKAALPIGDAPAAAAAGSFVYAIGGFSFGSGRLANVYRYDPKTNKWTTRASLRLGRSNPGVGTYGKHIVVADGLTNSGVTGETEVYSTTTDHWGAVATDSTARTAVCAAVVDGKLYSAGGQLGGGSAPTTDVLHAYDIKNNLWSSKAKMPQASVAPASAFVGGRFYCISGASSGNPNGATFYNKVQIYQP